MSTPEPKSQGFLENTQIAEIILPFSPLLSSQPERGAASEPRACLAHTARQ